MKPSRAAAGAQLGVGLLLLRRPARSLQLLGYPTNTLASRSVLRVLGTRHVIQGIAVARGDRTMLRAGAAVDVTHALTCAMYARRSAAGRRAGLRSAAVAVSLAVVEVLAARKRAAATDGVTRADDDASTTTPARENRPHPIPRVSSANAAAWPEPAHEDDDQLVLVGTPVTTRSVRLTGGVMDGATVMVPPGATAYDVVDTDHGVQRYVATGETDVTGAAIFTLTTE